MIIIHHKANAIQCVYVANKVEVNKTWEFKNGNFQYIFLIKLFQLSMQPKSQNLVHVLEFTVSTPNHRSLTLIVCLRIEQGGLVVKCYALFNELSIYWCKVDICLLCIH